MSLFGQHPRLFCSAAALCLGFFLDLAIGDPRSFPHIIRAMGGSIRYLELALRRALPVTDRGELAGGALLAALVPLFWGGLSWFALDSFYRLALGAGLLLESLACWQLLAVKGLRSESLKVCAALTAGDLTGARAAVGQIVGRDTAELDAAGIARAAVETVAENTADACVAPLFYLLLGGVPLGCVYKVINTLDSMVGYKSERYLYFGRCAARLDDAASFLPARLAALLMTGAAYLSGFDAKNAWRVYRRDRKNHASPNSAHTEAVCAGALGLRLGGSARYFGRLLEKPTIGDALRPIEAGDIARAGRLLYVTAGLALVSGLLIKMICLDVMIHAAL